MGFTTVSPATTQRIVGVGCADLFAVEKRRLARIAETQHD